mmetsp:Transcript_107535/g.195604  ORF Transcript_107535/g.195604 Transcript_107535/m.195604 type:complete len:375 (+) Transcript_107535:77-1201(+)
MHNKVLAVVTNLLFVLVSSEDPHCSYPVNLRSEIHGEGVRAISLLQKSAVFQRESSSISESGGGLDEEGSRQHDEQFVGLSRFTAAARDFGERLPDIHTVVARINARFGNGRPSKKINEAGVIVHAFDGAIMPGAADADGWFAANDYWSASLINARMPYMYLGHPEEKVYTLHAGFVISPESAADSLLCSYAYDGITTALYPCTEPAGRRTQECVPGCVGWRGDAPTAPKAMRQWCSINTTVQLPIDQTGTAIPVDDFCAWPPDALDAMMNQQEVQKNASGWVGGCTGGPRVCAYNEIILNPSALREILPKAIEAIYFVTGAAALSREHARKGRKEAKAAQRFLWKTYGQRVPLVRFNSLDTEMPFALASAASG